VVSKEKYYELKNSGLCVRCGEPRTNSPSEVRCKDCHTKFLDQRRSQQDKSLEAGLCIQCKVNQLVGNSKYCNECREKNANYKKSLTNQPISKYQTDNRQCRMCNGPIDTLGVVCQKCLEQVQFSKVDAVIRYGQQCSTCIENDIDKLTIVSTDISVAMKHTGPELYKYICFSTNAPKEYIVMCAKCYWQSNLEYIKNIRSMLLDEELETNSEEVFGTIIKEESDELD